MSDHVGIVSDLSHEQYIAASGVSSSMLKILREKSPLHLRAALDFPEPPTDAQRIGSITHRALLLPDTFKDAFHVKPDDLSFTTKEGKAWRLEHADRPLITAQEQRDIAGMIQAVQRHPMAKRLMASATYEQSIFVTDSHGTTRKLRPDILPRGGNLLPDLKTCESAQRSDFEKVIGKYGYWLQGAYYLDGCRLAGMEFENFVLIAVEKNYPYAVATYNIDPIVIDYGRRINNAALETYRQCVESGLWPGYEENISYIGLPPWLQKEAEQAA